MIKRITALFLIITATVVLLADSVIPHHHHGETICFDSSHCCTDHHTDDFPVQSSHNHGNEDDCGSCKLKQTIMIPNMNHYDELISNIFPISNNLIDQLPVHIKTDILLEFVTTINFSYCKYLLIIKCSEEGSFSGLRAPPLA